MIGRQPHDLVFWTVRVWHLREPDLCSCHCVNTGSMVLASLRDTLLPKLISAELPVTDTSRAEATH